MEKVSFNTAIGTLTKGHALLGVWVFQSSKKALYDMGGLMCKHPIFAIILVLVYLTMFYVMATSRARYIHANKELYLSNKSLDSLKVLTEIYVR